MLADVLGVGIGLFLIYLLLSLIGSTMMQWLSNQFGWRSKLLKRWMVENLSTDSSSLVDQIYKHPLLRILRREKKADLPSHIPSRWLAFALVDVVRARRDLPFPSDPRVLREEIAESSAAKPDLRNALLLILDQSGSTVAQVIDGVARWFDDSMVGLRDAYKAFIEQRIFFFALIVAAALNIDTIMVGSVLWRDFETRHAFKLVASNLLSEAGEIEGSTDEALVAAKAIVELSKREVPIGWTKEADDPRCIPNSTAGWFLKFFGIMATTLATSLGAPFWFDLLRKIIGIERGFRQSPSVADDAILSQNLN
ncbi:MAG: hypothetical protein ACUVUU_07275 [bacterium]